MWLLRVVFNLQYHVAYCVQFSLKGITSTVKASLEESLVQILSPQRRIDILRDAMDAKRRGKPYSITFCGVNGVGKSTNLAKVMFRMLKNNQHQIKVLLIRFNLNGHT